VGSIPYHLVSRTKRCGSVCSSLRFEHSNDHSLDDDCEYVCAYHGIAGLPKERARGGSNRIECSWYCSCNRCASSSGRSCNAGSANRQRHSRTVVSGCWACVDSSCRTRRVVWRNEGI